MKTIIGIDNGTQSTKVVFYEFENKKIVASASASHDLISREDGSREQKASWWIDALTSCFEQIDPEIKKTALAAGVSGQQHGFVPIDEDGNVLNDVKLWCDTSTAGECRELTHAYGSDEKLLEDTGNLILPGYTASKILWFKKAHPAEYAKMKYVLLPHDYLNYYLTGKAVMEYGDASGTALLDVRNKIWHKDLIKALDPERDLMSCLPKLIEPWDAAGTVLPEIADKFGIPRGIPVSSGGGDNMMGALGTGTTKDGVLTMSLGTSGTLYGYSDKPIVDPQGNLAAFCSSSGGWLPLLCTMNCTVATELMRDLFEYGVKEFDEMGAKAPVGAEGILTLPFFNGERTPNLPKGKGCIVGMTAGNVKKENIFRSALESAILGMKVGLDSFEKLGFEAKEIRLIGGGANSKIWRQITADVMNLPVVIPVTSEAAALGSAVQALWCLEKAEGSDTDINALIDEHVELDSAKGCTPNSENVEKYKAVYEEYSKYVNALTPLFS
ncbi:MULTISPECIES: xylulokinase [unclassified Oceanispirochaeta]|uniref:xylulokinase n=1 Tax=unclassified Oceanispirochaeta TaxID=2635722 RepID=UPI000E0979F5|nr:MULTISPECIES: xylulokinase [unclassified Oceanispirochaeta]MBF9017390.1 xylulokinase [Oceanispirochaeta sp. M2]NPD73764.1 xylulokinase [Oceanispirochaeta sp. M1]RDG30516.1 xylulokinase [Oceanispirochaeta sp. M1]